MHKIIKVIILIAMFGKFLIQEGFSQANTFDFKNITTDNGLSHSNSGDIIQDNKGFIWISTMNGLNKYDGYEFEVYLKKPNDKNSLPDNQVGSIFQDSYGNLWIDFTSKNLCRLNTSTGEIIRFKSIDEDSTTISGLSIQSIVEDSEKNIWIGTDNG